MDIPPPIVMALAVCDVSAVAKQMKRKAAIAPEAEHVDTMRRSSRNATAPPVIPRRCSRI